MMDSTPRDPPSGVAEVRNFRIFVSSPRDVGQERAVAAAVIERLRFEFRGVVALEPVFWEQLPMRATDTFQAQIPLAAEADIGVFILWSWFGTPLPESFKKADGTAFGSGTEFEFENAVQAHLKRGAPDILVYRKTAEPRAAIRSRAQVMEQLAQGEAVTAFIDRYFRGEGGTFKAAFREFGDTAEFEEMLEQHLRELVRDKLRSLDQGAVAEVRWQGSPFRGLEAFDLDHALIFCGRTRAVSDVVEALHRQRDARGGPLVVITGGSGSGKSSLARAGVLRTLTQPRVVEDVACWRRAVLRPAASPLRALAQALLAPGALPELGGAGLDEERFATLLGATPDAAVPAITLALGGLGEEKAALALVVDQFEELFAPAIAVAERDAFARALATLARSKQVWIVITLRADFYPRCAELPDAFQDAMRGGVYELHPPRAAEVAQMIRRPAAMAGLLFERRAEAEEGLDDRLRDAAAAAGPGALPLLQFTLDQLYQRRSGRLLRFADYDALGGLTGALRCHADGVFAALPPEAQAALPRVLSLLLQVALGAPGAAAETAAQRPASRAQIAATPGGAVLADAFVAERLLVADRAEDGSPIVRVAHEALLREWPRARDWIAANREALAARGRVAAGEALWAHGGRAPGLLLTGAALAEAEALRRGVLAIAPELDAYIAASRARALRRRRAGRARLAAAAAALLTVLGGTGWWWEEWVGPHAQLYPVAFDKRFGVYTQLRPAITPAEAVHRNTYLRVTTRGRRGPTILTEVLNGSGACPQSHEIGTYFGAADGGMTATRPCRWTAVVAEGRAEEESAYDSQDRLAWTFLYANADRTVGEYHAPDGRALAMLGNGASGLGFRRETNGPLRGMDLEVRYLNPYGRPQAGPDGNFGLRYDRDPHGRIVGTTFLGADGHPAPLADGAAADELTYDSLGRIVESRIVNAAGQLTLSSRAGLAVVETEYDAHDNVTTRRAFDAERHPRVGNGGWATERSRYDDRGNRTEVRYEGERGTLVRPGRGWALARWQFDGSGRQVRQTWFDEKEQPLAIKGAYGEAYEYGAQGNLARRVFLAADGTTPARDDRGVVTEAYRYDAGGRQIGLTYEDDLGTPTVIRDGFVGLSVEKDDAGRDIHLVDLGPDGKPVVNRTGFAGARSAYDDRGNLTSTTFYDTQDRPMLVNGMHRRRTTYDDSGRKLQESFEGLDGQPVAVSGGIAGIAHAYDRAGNEIETTYLDVAGHPLDRAGLCARFVREFDAQARETSSLCVGASGTPAVGPAGFARAARTYDAQGRQVESAYFDAGGKPARGPEGWATMRLAYDADGNPTDLTELGPAGEPLLAGGACGHTHATWEDGKLVKSRCVPE